MTATVYCDLRRVTRRLAIARLLLPVAVLLPDAWRGKLFMAVVQWSANGARVRVA
jgi:hypothetical protein